MINTKNKEMLTMIPIVAALWQHVNSNRIRHLAIDDVQNTQRERQTQEYVRMAIQSILRNANV